MTKAYSIANDPAPCLCGCGRKPKRTQCHQSLWCTGHNNRKRPGPCDGSHWGEHRRMWVSEPDHPRANKDGKILRCWQIAETVLGRQLRRGEVVHHINGDPTNDRHGNLVIMQDGMHKRMHALQNRLGGDTMAYRKTRS